MVTFNTDIQMLKGVPDHELHHPIQCWEHEQLLANSGQLHVYIFPLSSSELQLSIFKCVRDVKCYIPSDRDDNSGQP